MENVNVYLHAKYIINQQFLEVLIDVKILRIQNQSNYIQ